MNIQTTDLYYAAWLQVIGCNMETITNSGTKKLFILTDAQNRTNLKDSFFNERPESAVVGLKFANAIRNLKTLIHS